MKAVENNPVVIEAAISPLRRDVPVQSADEMAAQAMACLAAGAGIIHHHHDMRLDPPEAAQQLVEVGEQILAAYPTPLIYTDYLTGRAAWEENAHLRPMAEAGVLTMFAIDPGITTFASFDTDGLPTRTYTDGLKFSEAHEMVEFAKEMRVPMSLGVFEPGHLRWIVAYSQRAGFPPGSIIKLYFGGEHMVDRHRTKGLNFGLPPTTGALDVYRSMMEGCHLPWIVSLFGDALLDSPLARYALEQGGHLRVGIEDAAGMTDMTNPEIVAAAVELANQVARPAAMGDQVRSTLAGPLRARRRALE
jgi:3-keto-5-aminohexanoate cleavage enzyme